MNQRHYASLVILSAILFLTGCTFGSNSGSGGSGSNGSGSGSSSGSGSGSATQLAPSISVGVAGPIFAAANQETVTIGVVNDLAGDTLSASETVTVGQTTTPCPNTNCGTFSGITGTSGSGSYTMTYTPPGSISSVENLTLTITSSIAGALTGTATFSVNPAGSTLIMVTALNSSMRVAPGAAAINLTAKVYNDPGSSGAGNLGASFLLLGSGYTCPVSGSGTVCGALGVGAMTEGTTSTGSTGIPYTQTALTYTPPPAANGIPNPPYDRPQILAVSNADNTKVGQSAFVLSTTAATNLVIPDTSRLNSALTGSAAITLTANLSSDSGALKTINWTLTANGANCPSACGSLGTPTYARNGVIVTATVTYTPPSSVPSGRQASPTITATSVDSSAAIDSFSFDIVNGACGSGHESVLSGNYAFLVKGGNASNGYNVFIGSFIANGVNGNGLISSGFEDANRTTGPVTGLTLTGTYSVGADYRGCMTLVNSNGGTQTFRFALGTVSGGAATQGSVVEFVDNTGESPRTQGVLLRQNTTAFNPSSLDGTYVWSEDGVDYMGGAFVTAGMITANGVSTLSNGTEDFDDTLEGAMSVPSGISGTFSLATNASGGRGTSQVMVPLSGGGVTTSNSVFYIVSPSEFLTMTTDFIGSYTTIVSGVAMLQTGPFTATTLDSAGYVFDFAGMDGANGGNATGLTQFTVTTNGATTFTRDINDNGTENPEAAGSFTFNIAATGRTTLTSGSSELPEVIYLVNATQGFSVTANAAGLAVFSGYVQKQTGGPYSNTTVPATAFVGGGARNSGSPYDVLAVTFNTAGATISGFDDESSPNSDNGLNPNQAIQSVPYSFAAFSNSVGTFTPTATGQGIIANDILAYIVSPTQMVFMNIGATSTGGFGPFRPASALSAAPAELFTGQQ